MPPTTVHQNRWKILAVLSLSLVIIGLDNTVMNVALPSIQEELGVSGSTLQWIVDAYMLVFAGLLLAAGNLGDRHGRKRALQSGLAHLRARQRRRRVRLDRRSADRRSGGDGHRRSADHALDAVDHHGRLPAGGARQGDERLGRRWRPSASASGRSSAAR